MIWRKLRDLFEIRRRCRKLRKNFASDQIAAEVVSEIECLAFDGERNVYDWERIIKNALEKAYDAGMAAVNNQPKGQK